MGKRFVADFMVNQSEAFVGYVLTDFFRKEGFELTDYQGERVWKKGVGLLTAPQFMKISYQAGHVHLEAWLKFAILPGVYCGEMGLEGFFGFAVKEQLKSRVYTLIQLLQQQPAGQQVPPQAFQAPAGQPPAQGTQQPPYQQAVAYPHQAPATAYGGYAAAARPVVHDPTEQATMSLVLGLVGLLAWLIPFAGLVTGTVGIVTAMVGIKSSARSRAIAGLVLSILTLVLSVFGLAAAFLLMLW